MNSIPFAASAAARRRWLAGRRARLAGEAGDPQEPGRAPAQPAEDRRGQQDADARPLRGAHRHRHPLHRRAGQLPDPGPADRHQDARQPHRGAHRQAQRDRLRQPAAEGRDRHRSRATARARWRCSTTRTAATASASSATCRRSKDVTIYTFLYPILGPDSDAKSRNIWCAKDKAKAWRDWMVDGTRRRAKAAASATPRRSSATSSSAASTTSTARRRWCSPTARACRARCRRAEIEKQLVAATPK